MHTTFCVRNSKWIGAINRGSVEEDKSIEFSLQSEIVISK
jgi:hypothetical protein